MNTEFPNGIKVKASTVEKRDVFEVEDDVPLPLVKKLVDGFCQFVADAGLHPLDKVDDYCSCDDSGPEFHRLSQLSVVCLDPSPARHNGCHRFCAASVLSRRPPARAPLLRGGLLGGR